jgi:hypothetical protein
VGALMWMRATWVALAAFGVWACGDREPSAAPRSEPSRTPAGGRTGYREVDVTLGGSVYGRVTWVGERPPIVRASLGAGCAADDALPLLTVGPRGGVANTVVVLTGVHEGRPMSAAHAELTFSECRLAPHLVAVPRGSLLRFASADPFLHNAHAVDAGGTSRFDVAVLPGAESTASLRLDEAGILLVRDDAGHPGAHAWIHVVDHPYFAVTDPGGAFRIEDVPVGRYTLMVWHEGVTAAGTDGSGWQDTPADFQLDLRLAADAAADGTEGGR